MIFIVANAVVFAVLLLIVVVPALYVYNPDRHAGEAVQALPGEVLPDESVTRVVRQKLYLLFIIPACAAVNVLFLYFAYYRPLRFIHYRVELNVLTLRLTLETRWQQLRKGGVLAVSNRSVFGGGISALSFSMTAGGSATHVDSRGAPPHTMQLHHEGSSPRKLASTVNWEWRRHARPKSVRKDAWVNSAVFAEIDALRGQVEERFLIEAHVTEASFTKAALNVLRLAAQPFSAGTLPRRGGDMDVEGDQPSNLSIQPTQPPYRVASTHGTAGQAGGGVVFGDEKIVAPRRETSVLLLPRERSHRVPPREWSGPRGGMDGGNVVPGSLESKPQPPYRVENSLWGRRGSGAGMPSTSRGNVVVRTNEPVNFDFSSSKPTGGVFAAKV